MSDQSRRRGALAELVRRYPVDRGNWEVDCPAVIEPILDMAAGRAPVSGQFAAVAADCTYTLIALCDTEEDALLRLLRWALDDEYPKRPVVLADLASGALNSVEVSLAPATALFPLLKGESTDVLHPV